MRIIPILLMWPLLAMGLRAQSYDLLLKGGQVIDPANGIDSVRDVAIAGGRIAAVTADIPESSARTVTRGHLSRVTSDKRTGVLLDLMVDLASLLERFSCHTFLPYSTISFQASGS